MTGASRFSIIRDCDAHTLSTSSTSPRNDTIVGSKNYCASHRFKYHRRDPEIETAV